MKTTIDIADGLLEQARQKAAKEKTTLKAIIHAALRGYLANDKTPRKKFKLRDGSVKGEGLMPGIEEGNWSQIRSLIYEGHGG